MWNSEAMWKLETSGRMYFFLTMMIYIYIYYSCVWFSRVKWRPVFMTTLIGHVFGCFWSRLVDPVPRNFRWMSQKSGLSTRSLSILWWSSLQVTRTCNWFDIRVKVPFPPKPSNISVVKKGRCCSKAPIFYNKKQDKLSDSPSTWIIDLWIVNPYTWNWILYGFLRPFTSTCPT